MPLINCIIERHRVPYTHTHHVWRLGGIYIHIYIYILTGYVRDRASGALCRPRRRGCAHKNAEYIWIRAKRKLRRQFGTTCFPPTCTSSSGETALGAGTFSPRSLCVSHTVTLCDVKSFGAVCLVAGQLRGWVSERVSSCLTSHQHRRGHLVPL